MKEVALIVIVSLYSLGGIMTFIGFIPTMLDLWSGKPSANISTYLVWTATTLFTSLYALFVVKDMVFIVVINLQLLACILVLCFRIRLGYMKK